MIRTTLWVIFFAIILDITINNIFTIPYPYKWGAELAYYFDYGRSVESKIVRMVSDRDSKAHIRAKIGWFKTKGDNPGQAEAGQTDRNIYIYGMSFSNKIGTILSELDSSLNVKLFHGPGAPLNHSYAYYESTRPHQKGDVVILGILASSLPLINTLTHVTSSFESPSPHFYPRYRIDNNNQIVKDEIDIKSLSELRGALKDVKTWSDTKSALAQNDSFYDPVVFDHNLLDYSVYFRLLRRALGQRNLTLNYSRYHDSGGFKNEEGLIDLSQRIVSEFVDRARADGAVPYLILFNDRDYDDHLYQVLKPVLINKEIPYYSTHQKFPATNLDNFIPDGHFKPEIDTEIAKEVLRQLKSEPIGVNM